MMKIKKREVNLARFIVLQSCLVEKIYPRIIILTKKEMVIQAARKKPLYFLEEV